jgi:hypothetical protein
MDTDSSIVEQDPNDLLASDGPFDDDIGENKKKRPCCYFWRNLWQTYDHAFLLCLGLQYFNAGAKTMVTLAYMLQFKDYYHLEPAVS